MTRAVPLTDYGLDQYGDTGPLERPDPAEYMDDPADMRHPKWGRPAPAAPVPGNPWTDPHTVNAAIERTRTFTAAR